MRRRYVALTEPGGTATREDWTASCRAGPLPRFGGTATAGVLGEADGCAMVAQVTRGAHRRLDYRVVLAELQPERARLAAIRWHGRLELESAALTLVESQLTLADLCAGSAESVPVLRRLPLAFAPRVRRRRKRWPGSSRSRRVNDSLIGASACGRAALTCSVLWLPGTERLSPEQLRPRPLQAASPPLPIRLVGGARRIGQAS